MSEFKNFRSEYAEHYESIYEDKNYDAEVQYISNFFKHSAHNNAQLLDIGCGAGQHIKLLANQFSSVTGIDLSHPMILRAKENCKNLSNVDLFQKDAKDLAFDAEFECVVSLFAVVGYLGNNTDILEVFKATHRALKSNGVFMFDCWHGAQLLSNRISGREKHFTSNNQNFKRTSKVEVDVLSNSASVHFSVHDDENLLYEETHKMRFFFCAELKTLLNFAGFKEVRVYEFLSMKAPTIDSSSLFVVASK